MASVSSTSNVMQSLNADAFLKLFITQLQNQDPDAPLDPSQMTSQLAQLTSVQKLDDMSTSFSNVMKTERMSLAKGLIGSTVGYTSGSDQLSGTVQSAQVSTDGTVGVVIGGAFVSLDNVNAVSPASGQ